MGFERHVPPKYLPLYQRRGGNRLDRDRYIKLKYVRRRFAPISAEAPHERLSRGMPIFESAEEYPIPTCDSDDEEDVIEEVDAPVPEMKRSSSSMSSASGRSSIPSIPPWLSKSGTSTLAAAGAAWDKVPTADAAWGKVPS